MLSMQLSKRFVQQIVLDGFAFVGILNNLLDCYKSVIPKKEIGTAFVYYFLKENKQLIESHASGTTFMEVSGNVLKNIPAIVPKPEVAAQFTAICTPLFNEQRQNELEIGRLQELQQTLVSSISSR